ncbi:MAG: T9SS type A sorting domain-containing protein [Bacteroidetes bacterium]|nr:T9SS type A sorting domain-containing protein [Bacteroidota bacterium]MCW5895852.1 T9SS type A sorting domain-containing protein [Bacteroidota bacterium]
MKSIIIFLMLFISPLALIAQTPAPFVLDEHTVALWHYNETGGSFVRDTSLFGNHGTAYGTTVTNGRFGNARSFNGTSDFVHVNNPSNGSLGFGANKSFTIDVWFKTTTQLGWLIRKGLSPTAGYGLVIKDGYLQGELGNREDSFFPDTLVKIRSQQLVNDGQWHLATLERDHRAGEIRLYVDGVLATSPINDPIIFPLSSDRPLTFGKWENNVQPQYFNGVIDEARISNVARSAPPVVSDTVALWHYDEFTGSLVADSGPYGNDGNAYGTTIVAGVSGNARSFSGSYNYVFVQNPVGMNFDTSQSFTVEAWFKTTQQDTGEIIRRGLAPLPGFALRILNGKVQGIIGNRDDTPFPDTLLRITSTESFNDNQWHKATLIRDRSLGRLFLYVDGLHAATPLNDPVTFPLTNARPLTMGSWENFVQPTFFRGVIDEVRIMKGALHPSNPFVPTIEVSHTSIDFGRILLGSYSTINLVVRNTGLQDTLHFGTETNNNVFEAIIPVTFPVPPGTSRIVPVTYTPIAAQTDTGTLSIHSNDPNRPVVRIALRGQAFAAGDAPVIMTIRDVPADQGKQVRIIWHPSIHDRIGDSIQVVQYGVWRRVAGSPGLWDFVATIPAVRFEQYSFVAPTLYDSTRFGGMHWSVFRVSAHSVNNVHVFFSDPDSGYSVDNISPAPPANPFAVAGVGQVNVGWDQSPEPDVMGYWVYRSAAANFIPAASNRIGTATGNAFVDLNVSGSNRWYYRVTAFDSSGNESVSSGEVSVILTGAGGGQPLPTEFALYQNFPNPFNPSTTIKYDVPEPSLVRIAVYDMLGREVAVLVDEMRLAGRHQVSWNAAHVASGMYVYRMQAGGLSVNKKLVFLK